MKYNSLFFTLALLVITEPVYSQTNNDLDIDPQVIKESPVLQRWQKKVPSVWDDIMNNPSFKTRVRLGYDQFPSNGNAGGWNMGVEDFFIGKSRFTISADYQGTFSGDRSSYGADLKYYIRPLGTYINFAPVVGYRNFETKEYNRDGVNLGARLQLSLSRGGAADLALTQSWVSPGSDQEIGLTSLSVGYAMTKKLRFSVDIQKQNAPEKKDSRVGLVLEWMP